jgi:hypothetical protein
MTVVCRVIVCDQCGADHAIETNACEAAAEIGWVKAGDFDLCPSCVLIESVEDSQ